MNITDKKILYLLYDLLLDTQLYNHSIDELIYLIVYLISYTIFLKKNIINLLYLIIFNYTLFIK